MDMNAYFKSIVDQDNTAIVICDLNHTIIYMNPAAIKNYEGRGAESLLGKSLFDCHAPGSNKSIQEVVDWFAEDPANNRVHINFNKSQNKDLYMIALRDNQGKLIGYFEKHEFRTKDNTPFYDMGDSSRTLPVEPECDLEIVKDNLIKRGFKASVFESADDAVKYIKNSVKDATVGFGGSMTLKELGLYEELSENNNVYWHWQPSDGSTMDAERDGAAAADYYFSSLNGLSMAGDIINIDGLGNRVASTLYGHKKVFYIVGKNKLASTYEAALDRARNIASAKNATRFNIKTPCKKVGYCVDCASPDRICRELTVLWQCPMGGDYEVILIDEELGF